MKPLWDWDRAVADWTTAMQAAGRSPRTIRLYSCHLRKVIRECPDGPASVTSTDLRYVLSAGSWKPETRKSVRGSVTAFSDGLTERVSFPSIPRRGWRPCVCPPVSLGPSLTTCSTTRSLGLMSAIAR